jgi:hypothetical protein
MKSDIHPLKVLQPLNNSRAFQQLYMLNFKFRLYPTKEQESALEQALDGGRWVYNSLNHLHNGLQLLRLPAERRKSTPVKTEVHLKRENHRPLGRVSTLISYEELDSLLGVG